jgi:hypothetical protein
MNVPGSPGSPARPAVGPLPLRPAMGQGPSKEHTTRSAMPSRAAFRPGDFPDAAAASVPWATDLAVPGSSVGDGKVRLRPMPVADVEHSPRRFSSPPARPAARSRAAASRTRRSTASSIRRKPLAPDDVGDRLAPQPPPHHLAEEPPARTRPRPSPSATGSARPGRSPRRAAARRRARGSRLRPPAAHRLRTQRIAGAPRNDGHPTAAASSRLAFLLGGKRVGELCEVAAQHPVEVVRGELDRWSVTRPWGKL